MKKLVLLSVLILGMTFYVYSQVFISVGSSIDENFSIGTNTTATLPDGWKADKNTTVRTVGSYNSAGTSTERIAGDNMSSSATNGIYNYGAGDASSATDRALGGLSSSSSSKSVNIYIQLNNIGASEITDFTISYDIEKYRNGSNPAGFTIQMYYSSDGNSWTSAGSDFQTSFSADDNNNGFSSAPGVTINIISKTLSSSIGVGSSIYLAWNYSVSSGTTTSNAQGLGIDNFSITANGSVLSSPPVLSAAANATIDATFNVTFTDNASWSAAITSITVDGTSLDQGYSISTGQITFTPSLSLPTSLLQESGSKTIEVIATGYYNASVSQQIDPGAVTSNSVADIDDILTINSTRTVTLTAKDQYNNLVPGYTFKFDAVVTYNSSATDENYTVDGNSISASVSDLDVSASTDASGNASFDITIPESVDAGDGLSVQVQLIDGSTNIGSVFEYIRAYPEITITGEDPGSADFIKGIESNILYRLSIDVANDPVTLSQLEAITDGSYIAVDIASSGFKLWYSADNNLSGEDTEIGSLSSSNTGTGEILTFSGLSQTFAIGEAFLFITVDISENPTFGNTISGDVTSNSDLTFSSVVNYTGSSFAGANLHSISDYPTYEWIGADNASWTTSTNWNPERSSPAEFDILEFNGNSTKTVVGVPTETIGSIVIENSTSITFQTGGSNVLTISGANDIDLDIDAGSELLVTGSNALSILLVTGTTGNISGDIGFYDAAHRLYAIDENGLIFENGSVFTAGSGFTGNAFGNSYLNSVIFENNSTYIQEAGSNPFGASQPNSVVVFQSGSLYKIVASLSPSFSGRTYADFEIDAPSFNQSATGSNPLAIDNLILTNGSLNLNLTGGITINGNISLNSGALLGFNPGSSNNLTLGGLNQQTILGDGGLFIGANITMIIDNPSNISLSRDLELMGNLSFLSGQIVTGSNTLMVSNDATDAITGYNSSSFVNGNLNRLIANGINTYIFPIGTTSAFAPVTINFLSGTESGELLAFTIDNDHGNISTSNINPSESVNRTWSFSIESGLATANYDATFNWVSADEDAGFDYSSAIAGKLDGGSWNYPTMGTLAVNSAQITGVSGFSDFQIGNSSCIEPTVPTAQADPTTICSGESTELSITSGDLNDATNWQWFTVSCGGTSVGAGTTLVVSPTTTTTYYVRGEGGCATPGTCAEVIVTVNPTATISGYYNYYNIYNTALDGVAVELQQTGSTVDNTTTNASGYFEFTGICPGNYDVVSSSSMLPGSINSTDAAQVNYWTAFHSPIETTRFLAGDVTGDQNLSSGDASRIQQYFVTMGNPINPFASDWSFWKIGETISANPGPANYPQITINAGEVTVTQNFYGLVTGDFNRSYIPGSLKSGSENITLNYGQTIEVTQGTEFELPVIAEMDVEVGAISLILNFPSDLLEVNGVYLTNDPTTPLQYNISDDELRIGWNSLIAAKVEAGGPLFTLKLIVTGLPEEDGIRFTLAEDPLNELADASYEIINNAVLTVDVIKTPALGTGESSFSGKLEFSNHPNPFRGKTNFVYTIPFDGKVSIEIKDIVGNKVEVLMNETQIAGHYLLMMDADILQAGVYTATLKLENNGFVIIRTIKIISKN